MQEPGVSTRVSVELGDVNAAWRQGQRTSTGARCLTACACRAAPHLCAEPRPFSPADPKPG